MKAKGIIIGIIGLTFMLPLSFWYFQFFTTSTYFSSIPFGSYFLIGGLVGFLFTTLYFIIKS